MERPSHDMSACPVVRVTGENWFLVTDKFASCDELPAAALSELQVYLNSRRNPDLERAGRAIVEKYQLPGLAWAWLFYTSRSRLISVENMLAVPEPLAKPFEPVELDDRSNGFANLLKTHAGRFRFDVHSGNARWRFRASQQHLLGFMVAGLLLLCPSALARVLGGIGAILMLEMVVRLWLPGRWLLRPGGVTVHGWRGRSRAFSPSDTVLVMRPYLVDPGGRECLGWRVTLYGKGRRARCVLSQLECLMLLAAWRSPAADARQPASRQIS